MPPRSSRRKPAGCLGCARDDLIVGPAAAGGADFRRYRRPRYDRATSHDVARCERPCFVADRADGALERSHPVTGHEKSGCGSRGESQRLCLASARTGNTRNCQSSPLRVTDREPPATVAIRGVANAICRPACFGRPAYRSFGAPQRSGDVPLRVRGSAFAGRADAKRRWCVAIALAPVPRAARPALRRSRCARRRGWHRAGQVAARDRRRRSPRAAAQR